MHSMPYGVVKELKEKGWYEKKDKLSSRTLLHNCGGELVLVDNGYISRGHWLFIKTTYHSDIRLENDMTVLVKLDHNKEEEWIFNGFSVPYYKSGFVASIMDVIKAYRIKYKFIDKRPEAMLKIAKQKENRANQARQDANKFDKEAKELRETAKRLEQEALQIKQELENDNTD